MADSEIFICTSLYRTFRMSHVVYGWACFYMFIACDQWRNLNLKYSSEALCGRYYTDIHCKKEIKRWPFTS